MKCRHCNEELMDDVVICPACGGDNSRPMKKNWTPIIAIICCVILIIGVAGTVMFMNRFPDSQTEAVTVKACYTEADDTVKAQVNTVVAKAGDLELTNGELQVIYWSMVYDFVEYLGDYASYYIDFTKPLSGQYYNQEAGITWEHYFLDMALNTWRRYEVLSLNAEKDGVELTQTLQSQLDDMYENMESVMKSAGFGSVEEMVKHDFGNAATFEDYMAYMDIYYHGNNYYNLMYLGLEVTDAELEAYYTENETDLVSAGYGKDVGTVMDARHILIEPADDSDEAWATAKQTAQDLMDQWVSGGADEDTFADLAYEHSTCSSASNGGLLSGFGQGDMVANFDAWCFGQEHEYGDYGLVQTEFGWHIIFYVDSYELWREAVMSNLLSEKMYENLTAMENEYPMIVAYSRIVLADIPLI